MSSGTDMEMPAEGGETGGGAWPWEKAWTRNRVSWPALREEKRTSVAYHRGWQYTYAVRMPPSKLRTLWYQPADLISERSKRNTPNGPSMDADISSGWHRVVYPAPSCQRLERRRFRLDRRQSTQTKPSPFPVRVVLRAFMMSLGLVKRQPRLWPWPSSGMRPRRCIN